MTKTVFSLCLVLLLTSSNTSLAEITTPIKPEDFTKDVYNRFSCGGYAIIDHGIGVESEREFYIENTSELVCTFMTGFISFRDNEESRSCPPQKWFSTGCDNYHSTYIRLLSERFRLENPNLEPPIKP